MVHLPTFTNKEHHPNVGKYAIYDHIWVMAFQHVKPNLSVSFPFRTQTIHRSNLSDSFELGILFPKALVPSLKCWHFHMGTYWRLSWKVQQQMDISHVNHPNGGAKHLWTNMDMVWSNNLITILYRCIFAKPSTTHMENDENEMSPQHRNCT